MDLNEQVSRIKKVMGLNEQVVGTTQNQQTKKPVTSGQVDQGLVQKLNMLKELVGSVVNKVQLFVPKTVKLGEKVAIINTQQALQNSIQSNFTPYRNLSTLFQCVYVVFGDTQCQIRTISFELHGNSSRTFQEGSLSSQLAYSKDINEFFQNLTKIKPEVYAKEEPIYGTKELGIDMTTSEKFMLPMYGILNYFPNKLDGINRIKTILPNFIQLSLNAYANEKDMYRRKGDENTVKYLENEEKEFASLVNQQPNQVQPTPQPTN